MTNPGERAQALAQKAQAAFKKGLIDSAKEIMSEAFSLREETEGYEGEDWRPNHYAFTEALLIMSKLWYKLGNFVEGMSNAERAQAWADDPNCGLQSHFERSRNLQTRGYRYYYYLAGLPYRFRSLFINP